MLRIENQPGMSKLRLHATRLRTSLSTAPATTPVNRNGLVFICHSSTRGVVELLRDLFDYRISLGTVHNIVHSPVAHARRINEQYDLSTILIGLLDEIFQAADPVLVGVDAASTFCFLLSPEEHRDADTWGIRLLELVDRGFAPQATIADFASGLRAGHKEALPEVPCRGDVFHALYNVGPLARYLENRAYEAIDARAKLERKQATAKRRHGRKDQSLAKQLSYARSAEAKAIAFADEVALLARWLRDDILSVAGPEYAIRRDLLDFVVAELRARESACPHRIRPVRTLLEVAVHRCSTVALPRSSRASTDTTGRPLVFQATVPGLCPLRAA